MRHPIPIPRQALEAVIALAVGARADKGRQLQREGAVRFRSQTRAYARFWVDGGQLYDVHFHWVYEQVEPECNCPDAKSGFVCKHAVAVAYELLAEMQTMGAEGDAATGGRGDAATQPTLRESIRHVPKKR